jgi:hypothetical protein
VATFYGYGFGTGHAFPLDVCQPERQDGGSCKTAKLQICKDTTLAKMQCQQGKTMDLNTYITKGAEIAGTIKALADRLGVGATDVSNVKAGRRGLPLFACVRLAQLIGEDERRVIAASELVTEKNPERRAVWLPFVQEFAAHARKQTARTAQRASESIIFPI